MKNATQDSAGNWWLNGEQVYIDDTAGGDTANAQAAMNENNSGHWDQTVDESGTLVPPASNAENRKNKERAILRAKLLHEELKSPGAAVALAFLFGPFGVMYANVTVGLIMLLIGVFGGMATGGGIGVLVWLVGMFVAPSMVGNHNRVAKIRHELAGY